MMILPIYEDDVGPWVTEGLAESESTEPSAKDENSRTGGSHREPSLTAGGRERQAQSNLPRRGPFLPHRNLILAEGSCRREILGCPHPTLPAPVPKPPTLNLKPAFGSYRRQGGKRERITHQRNQTPVDVHQKWGSRSQERPINCSLLSRFAPVLYNRVFQAELNGDRRAALPAGTSRWLHLV